ncbi:MAG: hypothetical protein OXU88_02895, partial [Gammaproteobacteria bacterium]|nr:hypothetical protein [Gammaproteobacteria bacterium]
MLLRGADADCIEMLWRKIWWTLHYGGAAGPTVLALSAVDIALWDLKAERMGLVWTTTSPRRCKSKTAWRNLPARPGHGVGLDWDGLKGLRWGDGDGRQSCPKDISLPHLQPLTRQTVPTKVQNWAATGNPLDSRPVSRIIRAFAGRRGFPSARRSSSKRFLNTNQTPQRFSMNIPSRIAPRLKSLLASAFIAS